MGRRRKGRERKKERKRKKARKLPVYPEPLSFRREDNSVGTAWRYLEDECLQNLLEGWSEGSG